jgi:hypothetical protein
VALSFLLTTDLFDSIFADVLGAPQTLTPLARDAFLGTHSRTHESQHSSSALPPLRSPVSLEGLKFHLAGDGGGSAAPQPPGLSLRLGCLRTLVTATLFLAGPLGPSRSVVLEAHQNADYVLTTRGTVTI